ncbi:nucleotide disphospho-sugar-binding domain-containing protein [Thermomonospora umbrina]|uniref:Glycosyltransferase n=1 Tax=Thermomonospora umbrina TaxID=111806 RepID=A0A3D9SX01_9ACTN|nr:nucleotide disphospho-sugar-binding domain-containing protein [Thermomonospora umbrina]REE99040.1 glycosyltransferase [Thermomonospora umbrina]
MRILFLAGGSPATVYALIPLATAARNAGHETFMASTEAMMPVVAGFGLPAVPVTSAGMLEYLAKDRTGAPLEWPTDPVEHMTFIGRGFGRLAAASQPRLLELAEAWRPDVVVGGMLSFGAALLARRLGVPWVRHAWDSGEPPESDRGAWEELAGELAALGLDEPLVPDLFVEICPPSLRPPGAGPAQQMRYVPCAPQRRLEPWMYTKGEHRRVMVTAGARVNREQYLDFLRDLTGKVAKLDVEIVIATPDDVAADAAAGLDRVHAGWMPLDVIGPTCDLFVHHAGGGSSLMGMALGVPQLLMPNMAASVGPSERLTAYGAALMLTPGEDDGVEEVVSACRTLLDDPSYTERAGELAAEIRAQPLPTEVLGTVVDLAASRS